MALFEGRKIVNVQVKLFASLSLSAFKFRNKIALGATFCL